MKLTIGMQAIIESLEIKTNLSPREASAFMLSNNQQLFEIAVDKLNKSHGYDLFNYQPHANEKFWLSIGFSADYVVEQIDLNA